MTRKKKAVYNLIFSLIYQMTTIVCSFILPRVFLTYFGSAVNGLVSSVQHFLSFVTLLECGVGAVVQSAMYKPLADKDDEELSKIVVSSNRFFTKIMWVLGIYTIGLMVVYPFFSMDSFSFGYVCALIPIVSFSYFAQYYLFVTYRVLLTADQMGFVHLIIHSIVLILNTLLSVLLIKTGASVHVVKLGSAFVFLVQPLLLKYIIDRKYNLNLKIKFEGEPIKQKWNGFFQHIASVVLTNTPTVVLTLFSTLESVSVYSVYFLVVNGVKTLVNSLITGIQAMLGNMYAKKETETLNRTYNLFEWAMHFGVTLLFTCVGVLVVPFVMVYTKGVTDANYCNPYFAVMITLSYGAYCLRTPYNVMVMAAGHYKQTQTSAIIEAALHIVISVLCVHKFGLVGVSLGMFVAMAYRTIYFAFYISKSILYRKMSHFFKNIIVDILVVITIIISTRWLNMNVDGYVAWVILAVKVFVIATVEAAVINFIFYKNMFVSAKKVLFKKK